MSGGGICLLRIGDGRDEFHEQSWTSAQDSLRWDHMVTIDDRDHSLGFCGAIAEGWRQVIETGAEWVLHLELDFAFRAPVPIDRIIAVLKANPHLAQMSLKRQPCNSQEARAGGFVELAPDSYEQRVVGGDIWTEHRVCFTTNPSIYSAALCHQGWPQVDRSEGAFTHRLLGDPDVRFGIWGAKFDPPFVEHIGTTRAGHFY